VVEHVIFIHPVDMTVLLYLLSFVITCEFMNYLCTKIQINNSGHNHNHPPAAPDPPLAVNDSDEAAAAAVATANEFVDVIKLAPKDLKSAN